MTPPHGNAPKQLTARLTVPKVLFFVIAAAAPLGVMVGTFPLAFARGAGIGTPLMYAAAGVVLLCFSIGYAQMSRHVTSAGALYTFIALGIGRRAAVAAAFVAVVAYNALTLMMIGTFGYFSHLIIAEEVGVSVPWEWFAAGAVLVAALLGVRRADLSARLVGTVIVAELMILSAFDLTVIWREGWGAFPLGSFGREAVAQGSVGIGLMFAFTSYLGFEAAALYGEETENPRRSVPRATYSAVALITVFYGVTSWIAVGALGSRMPRSDDPDLGNAMFDIAQKQLGAGFAAIMALFFLLSLFGALQAGHNSASRYMFALGRERILPGWLGVAGHRGAPARASLCQTIFNIVVVCGFAIAGLHPYLTMAVSMSGLGTLGVVLLQAGTGVAVIGFFRHRPDRHWFRTALAPALGTAGLLAAVVLILANYSDLTGVDNPVVNGLPWVLVVTGLGGLLFAVWLCRSRPSVYHGIAARAEQGAASQDHGSERHPSLKETQ